MTKKFVQHCMKIQLWSIIIILEIIHISILNVAFIFWLVNLSASFSCMLYFTVLEY